MPFDTTHSRREDSLSAPVPRVLFEGLNGIEAIFGFVSDGVVLVDATQPNLPLVYVNRAFERLTGYQASEVLGRNCNLLQARDADQKGREILGEAVRQGCEARARLRNYRKDGSRFWNEVTIFPLRDSSGKVTHFVGLQNDVTAEVETGPQLEAVSEQLSVSQAQLQATFENMAEGVVVVDRNLNIVRVNRAASALLGLTDAHLSKNEVDAIFEAFLPDGSVLEPQNWPAVRALRGELVSNQEMTIRRKDNGKTVLVEVSSVPVTGAGSDAGQVLILYRDITEPRNLVQSRNHLAAIVESSLDAIIGKDAEGIITSWNKGAERLFGYTAAEMTGNSVRRLLPDALAYQEDEILARIRRGETVEHFETERKTKSGQILHVSLTISPIRDVSGHVCGASKIARDITERKQMEAQLRQSQKMEAIGQLTGGIAHDFNNLLGVVIGNLDLLERLVAGNDVALKRVHTAQKGAARGASLTRRLLAFSSKESLEPQVTSLNHAVRNTLELAGRVLGPEITIKTHLTSSLPNILVDVSGLESALLNLVVNARDAMPKGGLLSITTELRRLEANYPPVQTGEMKEGIYACVSVADTGHGMSREVLERAFEPFFTTKSRDKGTGLGLAMVYGFAKQSGGTVRLYSEPGYGTTVSLYLPLADGPVQVEAEVAPVAHSRKGQSVLVVDDEEDLLEIAVAYLEDMGFTAHHACDGVTALELLRVHPDITLVVTDIVMPGMNGTELAQAVFRNFPGVRVVYTSGFPAESLAERSMPVVSGPLLHKPYQRADFEKAVAESMRSTPADGAGRV